MGRFLGEIFEKSDLKRFSARCPSNKAAEPLAQKLFLFVAKFHGDKSRSVLQNEHNLRSFDSTDLR